MFDVNSDGNLLYSLDTGSGNTAAPPAGSLFSPDSADQDDASQEPLEDSSLLSPDAPEPPADIDLEVDSDPDSSSSSTGSGNNVVFPEIQDFSVTTSGDVYIYPDSPEEEPLAELRSVFSANVLGLPNSTSLSYLEDVVAGYPSWYKYMAFKSDANYSQSMVLWIAPQGVKSASQNRLEFTDVDCIEVAYVRSGSTNYYEYRSAHYDSYSIPYDPEVFLYTNVVGGYAQFERSSISFSTGLLFAALAAVIMFRIFKGGGKK